MELQLTSVPSRRPLANGASTTTTTTTTSSSTLPSASRPLVPSLPPPPRPAPSSANARSPRPRPPPPSPRPPAAARRQAILHASEAALAAVERGLRSATAPRAAALEMQGDLYRARAPGHAADNLDRVVQSYRSALRAAGPGESAAAARLCAKLARAVHDRLQLRGLRNAPFCTGAADAGGRRSAGGSSVGSSGRSGRESGSSLGGEYSAGTGAEGGATSVGGDVLDEDTASGVLGINRSGSTGASRMRSLAARRQREALLACVDLVNAAIGMYERHAAWCDDVEQAEYFLSAWVCRGLVYGALFEACGTRAAHEDRRALKRRSYVNECVRSLEHALASGAPRGSKADVLRDQKQAVGLMHCPAALRGAERARASLCVAKAYAACEDESGEHVEKALAHVAGVHEMVRDGGAGDEEAERLRMEAMELQGMLKATARSGGSARCVVC